MGITQLTVAYCNALVDDSSARAAYFTGFDFTKPISTAFDTTGRSQVIEPLLTHLLAREIVQSGGRPTIALSTQADPALLRAELNQLVTKMTSCGADCDPNKRTLTAVKATCSAALGSAVMLLQ